jgi:hypothetical protein
MVPQPSSRGVLGSINQFTIAQLGNSELTRGTTRRTLLKQDDDTWLLDDGTIPDGHYAYVTHLNKMIVVWPCSSNGNDTFHSGLSYFAPEVGYAGTVEFAQGAVVRWNADSGSYKPKVGERGQSGLPDDTFVRGQGY